MKLKAPCPGVKTGNHPHFRPQVLWIFQQFKQRLTGALEQEVAHRYIIETPQRIQLMRNRQNHVVMIAGQQPLFLFREPFLHMNKGTLRADTVFAGVVMVALKV